MTDRQHTDKESQTISLSGSESDLFNQKQALLANSYLDNFVTYSSINPAAETPEKSTSIEHWESIESISFNPHKFRIEAIIKTSQNSGYNGQYDSDSDEMDTQGSSTEYIRFFIDWGTGAGFQNLGLTCFNTCNRAKQENPLYQLVYINIDKHLLPESCLSNSLIKIRAILAWDQIPDLNPDFVPAYGSSLDTMIPSSHFYVSNSLDYSDTQSKGSDIPAYRMASSDTLKRTRVSLVSLGLNTATNTLGAVVSLTPKTPAQVTPAPKITWESAFISFWINSTDDSQACTFLGTALLTIPNQLPEHGVDYSATVNINPQFEPHLSRQSINDISIKAILTVGDPISAIDDSSDNILGTLERYVRVQRASNLKTFATQEGAVQAYGAIHTVGYVPVNCLDAESHLAFPSRLPLNPTNAYQAATDRPFSGKVLIQGRIYISNPLFRTFYQLQYAPAGSNAWLPVSQNMAYEVLSGSTEKYGIPRPSLSGARGNNNGWMLYQSSNDDLRFNQQDTFLCEWDTNGFNGIYDLRLAFSSVASPLSKDTVHYSETVTIVIDNSDFDCNAEYTTAPAGMGELGTSTNPSYGLDLVVENRTPQHDSHTLDYSSGEVIQGYLRARHNYFWKWILTLSPNEDSTQPAIQISERYSGDQTTNLHYGRDSRVLFRNIRTPEDNGPCNFHWQIHTPMVEDSTAVKKYSLTLRACNRAIIDSSDVITKEKMKTYTVSMTPSSLYPENTQ